MSGAVDLGGTLGYLGIDVGGSFAFAKKTVGQPLLTADFHPPSGGIPLAGGGSVPQAVTLRGLGTLNLLDHGPGAIVAPSINAKLTAALHGKATIDTGSGTPTVLGEGDIAVTIDDASDPFNPTNFHVTAGDFTTALSGFDVDPTNPAAMLTLILNGLRAVLSKIDVAGGAFDQSLPVLGKSPKQLFAQLDGLRSGIEELAGGPGPRITCGNGFSGGHVTGSADGLANAGGTLVPLRCQAELTKPAIGTPKWTVSTTSPPASADTAGASSQVGTTSAPPTDAVTLTAPAASGGYLVSADHPNGYRVTLTFTDADGDHTAQVPALSAPTSLQGLVDALTAKLGFPAGFLTVAKATVSKGGTPTPAFVLKLSAGLCSMDREGAATDGCQLGDRRPPAGLETIPVNLQLGSVGGLAGVSGQGTITTSLLARAKLGIAVPLSGDHSPLLLGDSGLVLKASAATTDIHFDANIGPLAFHVGAVPGADTSADPGVQLGAGLVKVGAGVHVDRTSGNAASDAYAPADFFDAAFVPAFDAGTQDCGSAIDGASTSVDLKDALACAKLGVFFGDEPNSYLADVGFAAKQDGSFVTAVPQALLDKLAAEVLSLQFVLDTLRQLVGKLHETLDGAARDVKLPVIGGVLDAGANVSAKLEQVVTAIQDLAAQLPSGEAQAFANSLPGFLYNAIDAAGATNVLRDRNASGAPDAGDISVAATCSPAPCGTQDVAHLTKLRVTLELGQGSLGTGDCTGACATDGVIPFDVGLDGLPVHASGALAPKAGWNLLLDFGVDRIKGPFLVVGHSAPEAQVAARIGFADSACATDIDPSSATSVAALNDFSSTRCLQGTLGFLGVNLRDRESAPSYIGVGATLRLSKKGASGEQELALNDLLAGQGDARFHADATADIALRVRTGIKTGETISLPSVIGILRISGAVALDSANGGSFTAPTVGFDTLYIDLGRTLSEFLGGIVSDVKRVTSPFKPVVDTLQAPLPVLSQLAALVGKPPVTMIDLLAAVSGADLSLVRSFLSVLQLINALPDPTTESVLIGLGSGSGASRAPGAFAINTDLARKAQTPDRAGDLATFTAPGTDLLGALAASHSGGNDPLNPAHAPYVNDSSDTRTSTFGVRGLEFPLFANASNVAKVLMGQDVKIVEYRMGTLKATAGFDVTFGPFFIGPVPVSVFIGGSVTLKGVFAFGYDTSGIRKVLDGASGEHLLDGLFLDDLDTAGNDVPEITLIGEVHAGAQVDLVVVKAGVEGGIRLTLDLNLHDDNHDGVLHIDEIANKLNNPICLFDVHGQLDFFLNFFLEFDFFFFEERFTFEILSIKLLDFSASCSGSQPPKLASQSGGTLTLLMGSPALRNARALAVDQINEKFTVRPIRTEAVPAAGGNPAIPVKNGYAVTAFGLTQEFGPAAKGAGHSNTDITQVNADGGDGDDQIVLTEGATNTETPLELRALAKAVFTGGPGKDVLKGGDGNDVLSGGDNDDAISGGAGDDTLNGDAGNDTLNGDLGNDTLHGGDGSDHANGGAGGDSVYGEAGNDVIDGGPAVKPGAGVPASAEDGTNLLVGGEGNDAITGGLKVDHIWGDSEGISCSDATADTDPPTHQDTVDAGEGADDIHGGPGDDQLTGGPDSDVICGNGGNDVLEGDSATSALRPGNDDLDGGAGNDVLFGRGGDDNLLGRAGNDRLIGDSGDDDLIGGTGQDIIDGAVGRDIVLGDDGTITEASHSGGQAARVALAQPAANTNTGANSCPSLTLDAQGRITNGTASSDADCISGGADEDVLFGGGGADNVFGDAGDDYLDGGHGADLMRGGTENDTMFGREEIDTMYGDSGADVMQGNEGNDVMRGGQGADEMQGNQDADEMYGDAGQDNMIGGSAGAGVPDGNDTIYGGTEQDTIAGDNALITRGALGGDPDDPGTDARSVTLRDVGSSDSALSGQDTVQGGDGNDRIYGQAKRDTLSGGDGKDRMFGNAGDDVMHGDAGPDLMVGGSEASGVPDAGDTMFGDGGADVLVGDNGVLAWNGGLTPDTSQTAGSFGDDVMRGNDGDDVMYGELGGDTMNGDADHDRMIGDLGTVSPTSSGLDPDGVPVSAVALVLPDVGGTDRMYGDGSADRMWGGAAADLMEGGPGNDYLEGNGGQDQLFGFNATVDNGLDDPTDTADQLLMALADDDDLIGGSSPVNPSADKLDTGELLIQGNGGHDVILGDNGTITRSRTGPAWTTDTIMGGLLRSVVLDDTSRSTASLAAVSGGETLIQGNDGSDQVFAEGGDDTVEGNAGDDVLVGNQGKDVMRGGDGQDDLIGGSLGGDFGSSGLVGARQLDDEDRLFGDAGADVIAGDNASVVRPTQGSAWATDPLTVGNKRTVTLWDTGRTADPDWSGNDLILGGDQRDRLFGQDGNDTVKGGPDDDFLEGNQGGDLLEGNAGEDDLIGGSRSDSVLDGGDVIHGGAGADVAIGDNGVIDRKPVLTKAEGSYYYATYQVGITSQRFVELYNADSADSSVAGPDQISGGSEVDVLFGQGDRDFLFGGAHDDYLEGNAASDFEFGDRVRKTVEASPTPQLLQQYPGGLPGLPVGLPLEDGATVPESAEPLLSGALTPDGQDDLIGGSSKAGRLDVGDFQYGDGEADFLLGDNGSLKRTISGGSYVLFSSYDGAALRNATRFCTTAQATCEASGRYGADYQEGNAGNDRIWGQDGDDTQYGGTEHDDLYGELGNDVQFGEDGEDVIVGDRAGITDTKISGTSSQVSASTNGPAFFDYTGLRPGQLDRRVDLLKDSAANGGGALVHAGFSEGGSDRQRGGRGHDSLHGAAGDDLMNGDSGGDWLFGDDGGDVMWGGKGSDDPATPNARNESTGPNAAVGIPTDNLVDYLFGGYGGDAASPGAEFTGGSDILDWRPRPGVDPASWFEMTNTDNADPVDNQHHQGIDWIYGGFDRDVLQGDVGKNGPDFGDRLMDWDGNFNLFSRCNSSYGDDGDIRSHSPTMQNFLQTLAYGSGAGATRPEVNTATTSGGRELALVYPGDKGNNGKPYPTSPGHFDDNACSLP